MLAISLLAAAVAASPPTSSTPRHFDVAASFSAPARPGEPGSVNVLFSPIDPDVRINEDPAPRLKLEPAQVVLVDRQKEAASHTNEVDPEKARYIDLDKPYRFPVAIAAHAPKGSRAVKANVVYFYCSKREGWCRRGTAAIEFTVDVP